MINDLVNFVIWLQAHEQDVHHLPYDQLVKLANEYWDRQHGED